MKLILHNRMPQNIISSAEGAYKPSTNTIHLARYDDNNNMISNSRRISILIHELCHWMICRLNLNKKWHNKLDGEVK
jgi:antirestriction protein ArdC